MEMISIEKYLRPGKPKSGDYIRFLQVALNAIALHAALTSKSDDLTRFRQEAATVTGRLSDKSSTEAIDEAVEFVIRAGEGYDRIAAREIDAHLQELQTMLGMMAETITYLSESGRTGIHQLQLVESTIKQTSTIDDMRVLRSRLDDCLTLVRKESKRLRVESRAHITLLQEGFERTASHIKLSGIAPLVQPAPLLPDLPRETSPDDPITGLRGREAAEDMIAANIAESRPCVVAIFMIDRFGHIKGRYGSTTADDVVLAVAQHLGEQLATGALFRWSGPAFAAVVENNDPFPLIEQRMTKIASVRIQKTLDKLGRDTLIAVNCSVIVQRVSDGDSLTDVVAHLDDFVATRG